jgi:hypothetical protein
MKKTNKIVLLFFSVFLLFSCSSKKLNYGNHQVVSKIQEKHSISFTKDDSWKFKQSFKLEDIDDNKIDIKFKDEDLKKYNFEIKISVWDFRNIRFFDADTIFYNEHNIHLFILKERVGRIKYIYCKQIEKNYRDFEKNKSFFQFYCFAKDSLDVDFLSGKFNEIEIIEKQ